MSREFDLDEIASIRRALDVRPQSSRAERTIDITTTGARTGQPRRIEIWFHHVDGRWYLSGMPRGRSWYANLKANPRFIVHLKHGAAFDLPAIARPVDSDTKRRVLSVVLALQNRSDLGTAGVPLQDPEEWQERSPMVEIEFEDARLRAR